MIDLHCHILPGIDDGAADVTEALKLLHEEQSQGVNKVVFTPHYNSDKIKLSDFLSYRELSLKLLSENDGFKKINVSFKVGAEVYFSVSLADSEIERLCFSDTKYILIELPVQIKPNGLMYTIDNVINRGYIPIIAHVERYSYIAEDPIILYDLVAKGCLAHINASAVLRKGAVCFTALRYIKWGLVQLICSDCHSMKKRPPNLEKAFSAIEDSLGKRYAEKLIANGEKVFNGGCIDFSDLKKPKKVFGKWL